MGNLISQDNGNRNGGKALSTVWQRFYLERLRRMVAVRRRHAPLVGASDSDVRLLDRSVYSTFCDCLDLAVGDEARAILRHEDAGLQGTESQEVAPN